ncbi:hypothetical protein MFRU_002g00770 [Monilinia fructicola]|uniref:Ecp2 effector protein domain-containing protein n=1 Tax=Monilinia fructicola TaxID=38448 RepID=A0A5M9K3V0_MONFR|nr:hypothetical protein EYC84_004613 [Monilinia fructicola]KAG4034724.1 hypothetical protein MFRU_002g00770 [Monilinia fructicola]
MHLSKIPCVLALASTVFAGQCYNHNEGAHKQKCAHKDELAKFADDYCHDHWSKLNGDWTDFKDRSGNTANIGKVANFSTKAACVAAFSQIVENCYDGWDGGQWVADGLLLSINFCKWSSEAKRVRFEGLPPPADAKRVRYEGLGAPSDAKRVRYEGLPPPADAKRVRYEGLPPPADAKIVAYQGLRAGVDL